MLELFGIFTGLLMLAVIFAVVGGVIAVVFGLLKLTLKVVLIPVWLIFKVLGLLLGGVLLIVLAPALLGVGAVVLLFLALPLLILGGIVWAGVALVT